MLILTGTYDETLYRQAMSCGADDFLTKPVRTEELLLRVKSLIRVRSLVAGLRASVATIETQNALILENREQREHMFDRYAQLETSTNRSQGRQNRGLGLAFCKAAVESHGGHIWMDENPGGGSRFKIELPNPAG